MTFLLDEPAVAVRSDAVVRVSGPDRLAYLHSLLSQDLESARAGTVRDFLYLDAKGNALAAGRAIVRDDDVLLVVPADVAESFVDALRRFTFLLQAQTDDLSSAWLVGSVRGPGQVDVPGAPDTGMDAVFEGGGTVVRDRHGGVDLVGPADWVQQRVASLGLPRAQPQDWEAWRIAAGDPGWGTEIAGGRRAQELGLLPTHVHLRKGCYPGQESIAKIYNLGRPRRVLAVAEFSGPVASGDPVDVGGKAGEITSAAPVGPVTVAMVLVPVDRDGQVVGDGSLLAGGVRGRVRRLVGAEMAIPGA
jgi:tRNA-modifying protein YgfZ